MPQGRGLGRRISAPGPRRLLASVLDDHTLDTPVERSLDLPKQYIPWYDQGAEGACTGFAASWMMSILNRRKYDARKLYLAAQLIDEWDDTPPGEGSSVNAVCEILRTQGHWRYYRGLSRVLGIGEGIESVRWATRVDELRAAVRMGIPFVLGVNWYQDFFSPDYEKSEWWIGRGDWGVVKGGHAICGYGASDKRQAFRLVNSWGFDYPRPWISYESVQRLLDENGEAALVTDRLERAA